MSQKRLSAFLVVPALAVAFLTPSPMTAQTLNKRGRPFPLIDLLKHTKGSDLPGALGTRLHELADWYGQTDSDFRDLCGRDKSIGADRHGRLQYVCSGIVAANGATSGWGTSGVVFQAPYADSQTFLLHSKPGATKVIYLDFNGNTTSGTPWNTSYTSGAAIVTPAYDIDGNPAAFSSTELANIQVIWQAVAEDYFPFDVDVTTQDPGLEGLRKTSSGDVYYGIRVCIGGSSQDWLKVSAGGVNYLNSFDWNSDTPAFVFPAQLGGGNPKFVAEATSHEVGHSFGLHHDGQTNGTEYYAGQGNWAPIMGSGYYKDVVQWSKGEYTLANNKEDDLALISGYVPYRADSVGNDTAHAMVLSGTALSSAGLIGNTGDVDVFSFSSGAGSISLTAKPASPSADLNVLFSLYNSAGTLVTSVGPTSAAAGVTITRTVSAGTYFLAVNGSGSGDPVSTGFSNYGSIGQFSISGTVPSSSNQAPVAVASNSAPLTGVAPVVVNFSSAGSKDNDGSISAYSWNFGDGTTSTAANPAHTYSTAGTYTAKLIVTDNLGLASAPASVTVTVQAAQKVVYVSSIKMSARKSGGVKTATAVVTVKDQTGAVKSGAKVTGSWSGLTTGSASATTTTSGTATLKSGGTKKTGTFTFTITNITLSGYTYQPARNATTSASIASP